MNNPKHQSGYKVSQPQSSPSSQHIWNTSDATYEPPWWFNAAGMPKVVERWRQREPVSDPPCHSRASWRALCVWCSNLSTKGGVSLALHSWIWLKMNENYTFSFCSSLRVSLLLFILYPSKEYLRQFIITTNARY